MNILISSRSEESLESNDYDDVFTIEIDGLQVLYVHDGEPEDNNLSRNFNDIYNIEKIMKKAYEAGKNGEELIIDYKDVDW